MVNILNFAGGSYTGEKVPGDLAAWDRLFPDPNKFLFGTYDLVSQSCLTLYHTYGPAHAAVNKHTDYAVGDGLYFRSQPDYELLGWTKEYARDWARRFQKLIFYKMADLNLFAKQGAAFRGALAGGDTVTYFVRDENGLDIVEFPGTEIDAEKDDADENITLGVKHDRFYRREGFYNRNERYTPFRENGRQNAAQFFLKYFPRQLRGYPLIYPNIAHAKNDDRFEDATLAAAVLEAMLAIITESESPTEQQAQIEGLANRMKKSGPVRKAIDALSSLGNAARLGTGNILNIRAPGKVSALDKKTPSNTYAPFKEWRLKQFGMGSNTPPEVVLSEYSTSYTAHRGALNDFIKTYTWEREAFNSAWNKPALKELATSLILDGILDAPGFLTGGAVTQGAYLKGNWLGPVPGAINPLQEITAKEKSVNNMFSLRSDEMFNLSGMDFEDVLSMWQDEEMSFQRVNAEKQRKMIAAQDEINLGKGAE